nr:MAG TPA: hypothetical protein [Caudoviricetes sp.]
MFSFLISILCTIVNLPLININNYLLDRKKNRKVKNFYNFIFF